MKDFMTRDLTYYFLARYDLMKAEKDYEYKKEKCRRYLRLENQLKEFKSTLEKYEPPLTRMHVRNVRKIRETECRAAKMELKNCQRRFAFYEKMVYQAAAAYYGDPKFLDVPKSWNTPTYDYSVNQNPVIGEETKND